MQLVEPCSGKWILHQLKSGRRLTIPFSWINPVMSTTTTRLLLGIRKYVNSQHNQFPPAPSTLQFKPGKHRRTSYLSSRFSPNCKWGDSAAVITDPFNCEIQVPPGCTINNPIHPRTHQTSPSVCRIPPFPSTSTMNNDSDFYSSEDTLNNWMQEILICKIHLRTFLYIETQQAKKGLEKDLYAISRFLLKASLTF